MYTKHFNFSAFIRWCCTTTVQLGETNGTYIYNYMYMQSKYMYMEVSNRMVD